LISARSSPICRGQTIRCKRNLQEEDKEPELVSLVEEGKELGLVNSQGEVREPRVAGFRAPKAVRFPTECKESARVLPEGRLPVGSRAVLPEILAAAI
jgi:hypothetical protein